MGLPPARVRTGGVVGNLGVRQRLSRFLRGYRVRPKKAGQFPPRWIRVYSSIPMPVVDMFSRVFLYWAAGTVPFFLRRIGQDRRCGNSGARWGGANIFCCALYVNRSVVLPPVPRPTRPTGPTRPTIAGAYMGSAGRVVTFTEIQRWGFPQQNRYDSLSGDMLWWNLYNVNNKNTKT